MNPMIGAALIGAAGQFISNKQTANSAKKQMEFQAGMSNTSYQRAMADMRAAGLNPILASKMGGASTPAGAMSQFGNVGAAASNSAQGFASAKQTKEQTEKLKAEVIEIKQSTQFKKILHDERWPRLAATMGPDNVISAAIMTIQGLQPEEILQAPGFARVINDNKVLALMEMMQEYKSVISREYAGTRGTGGKILSRAADAGHEFMKETQKRALDLIRFVMDASGELLK